MNDQNKTRKWVTFGKKFNGRKIEENSPIEITEDPQALNPTGKETFGVPIDVNVAVQLIRNLWEAIKPDAYANAQTEDDTLYKPYEPESFMAGDSDDSLSELKAKVQALLKEMNEAKYWLDELLMNSFSITFEKGALLKTLSQSGCEGIRFYLCLREEEKDKACQKHGILSLVTVGVDRDNQDLGYDYNSEQHMNNSLTNKSLCDEYGFLPFKLSFDVNDHKLDPFVLFKYALPVKPNGTGEHTTV